LSTLFRRKFLVLLLPVIFLGGTVFRGFDATTSSTFSAGDFTGVFGALLRALAFLVFVSFSSIFGNFEAFWSFFEPIRPISGQF
jgi:hypothetical protein